MKYHSITEYNGTKHYWWNKSKEQIISELVVPFINGQVISLKRKKKYSILNMKSVSVLTIYRTRKKLVRPSSNRVPKELKQLDENVYECTQEILSAAKQLSSSINVNSFLQLSFKKPENQVFIIMKLGDDILDSAYKEVIKPLLSEFGLNVVRVDEIQDSGKISDQILENIAKSKYILSDLSGGKPNCYYECGFAHALGKEVILCIKDDEDIHFDLAGYRFIKWKTESDLKKKLKNRINSLENSSNQ